MKGASSRQKFQATKRDVRRSKCENFKRPFNPRGWLRSASNFAKTRFRRFLTFHFSMSKNFFDKTFSKKFGVGGKFCFANFSDKFFCFLVFVGQFWRIYMKTDVTGRFLAIFCFRYTYDEFCTTPKHRKYVRFSNAAGGSLTLILCFVF